MMSDAEPGDVRTLLRQLPSLAGPLWSFDADNAPEAPQPLFADWLRFAAEVGIREPHAMTLSSVGPDGHPDARMLILKDLDEDWHFASDALSPKGRQIASAPHVALTFYWARLGRQVRVRGAARAMPAAASTADFRGRSGSARAVALLGRQSQPLAAPSELAEALEVSLEKVLIVQSDGKGKYGSQTSGGSSSVRELWMPIRKAGAAAREMLTTTAANRWNVPPSECTAQDGKIWHKATGKSLSYGELADDAAKLEIPKEPHLTAPKDFKIIGKYNQRLDEPDRGTGKAAFGLDADVPGMVYAAIVHSPMIHGKVVSINDAETKKVKGVISVMKTERTMPHRTSDAVAVVATNWWAALKGKKALEVKWDNAGYANTVDTASYFAATYEAAKTEGVNFEEKGDFAAKYTSAQQKLESHYQTPFLAHAPIEPATTPQPLRGPRGGLVLTTVEALAKKINSAVFPGLQGGPLMHVSAG